MLSNIILDLFCKNSFFFVGLIINSKKIFFYIKGRIQLIDICNYRFIVLFFENSDDFVKNIFYII